MPGKSDRSTNIQPFVRAVIRKRRNLRVVAVITACLAALQVELCVNMQCFVFFFIILWMLVQCIVLTCELYELWDHSFQIRYVEILELGLY
jgi:hypothetical protein